MSQPRSSELTFRPFCTNDFEAVRGLYRIVWGEQRDPRYDRMRMVESIQGLAIGVVAFAGDLCVGFYMVWPVPLSDGARIVSGAQPIDTMTHPEFQGKGILVRLGCECYRLCAESGVKVMFGAPNKAAYSGNVGRLNWSHTGNLRLYARPLSLRGVVPGSAIIGLAMHVFPLKVSKGHEVRVEKPSAAEIDACVTAMRFPERTWRVARSSSWYSYRYQQAGRFDYRWISVYRQGVLRCFSIVGIPIKSDGRIKVATLAEVVGCGTDDRRVAVGSAIRFAQDKGVHALITQSSSRILADALRSNGFIPVRRTPLITRALGPECFEANPFVSDAWELFGGDFDIM
jgi:GNAT superfamily N-acetyltransferase